MATNTPSYRQVLGQTETLYVRSMGRLLLVLAVFTSVDEANEYMEKHENAALVATFGPFFLLADKHDKGIKAGA